MKSKQKKPRKVVADRFWKALSKKALLDAWEKEDEVWDKKSNKLPPINEVRKNH